MSRSAQQPRRLFIAKRCFLGFGVSCNKDFFRHDFLCVNFILRALKFGFGYIKKKLPVNWGENIRI